MGGNIWHPFKSAQLWNVLMVSAQEHEIHSMNAQMTAYKTTETGKQPDPFLTFKKPECLQEHCTLWIFCLSPELPGMSIWLCNIVWPCPSKKLLSFQETLKEGDRF